MRHIKSLRLEGNRWTVERDHILATDESRTSDTLTHLLLRFSVCVLDLNKRPRPSPEFLYRPRIDRHGADDKAAIGKDESSSRRSPKNQVYTVASIHSSDHVWPSAKKAAADQVETGRERRLQGPRRWSIFDGYIRCLRRGIDHVPNDIAHHHLLLHHPTLPGH